MLRATLTSLLMCVLLTACDAGSTEQSEPLAASDPARAEAPASPDLDSCSDNQRPEVCAQFYKPVCGQLKQNLNQAGAEQTSEREWKTYGNACTACADHQVIGHKPGPCEESEEA